MNNLSISINNNNLNKQDINKFASRKNCVFLVVEKHEAGVYDTHRTWDVIKIGFTDFFKAYDYALDLSKTRISSTRYGVYIECVLIK
jgi:hypothetical protein